MFERFTQQARQVIQLAEEESRNLRHAYIGTEHILLGLLQEEGVATQVLGDLGPVTDRARSQVVRLVGCGEEASPQRIPFTPRAKKVLELALREALSLGYTHITPEHILLGLVRENEGVASRVLYEFEADAERIRSGVLLRLASPRQSIPTARQTLTRNLKSVRQSLDSGDDLDIDDETLRLLRFHLERAMRVAERARLL